jgi:hypothetical protein
MSVDDDRLKSLLTSGHMDEMRAQSKNLEKSNRTK